MSGHSPQLFRVMPGGSLSGRLRVPGDKSISHRSIMFASIANGTSRITGLLESEDVLATMAAFRSLGVRIEQDGSDWLVHGQGVDALVSDPSMVFDMGNSGTAMRLLTGLFAGLGVEGTLTGDASLSRRPMGRVVDPLRLMGALIDTAQGGRPPLVLHRAPKRLAAIEYATPMASAQVKSAVLLAGLHSEGTTRVIEPAPTRDHTERMLGAFGVNVTTAQLEASLHGGQALNAVDIQVPSDLSSAAFFLVAASIAPKSTLHIDGVGMNPSRNGVLGILDLMGANIKLGNERLVGGEPVADITVSSASLAGIDVPEHLVPLAIDEFPVLAVAAAAARGTTRISGAEELRVKESDRIAAVVAGLKALGVRCEEREDGMVIEGGGIAGGTVDCAGDHRLAMAFAMAALVSRDPVIVNDVANVATSFPGFDQLAAECGLAIERTTAA